VLVNAFVGAMVGMERSILPAIAEQQFHLVARVAILSFIVVFGVTKALTNYFAGRLSDRYGRKIVLVAGWLVAAPVPFMLMWAPDWNWVVAANALLGCEPGLDLVDHGQHEDRPGRPQAARPGDGPERVLGLLRAGPQCAGHRLDRGALRAAARARSTRGWSMSVSGWRCRGSRCARPAIMWPTSCAASRRPMAMPPSRKARSSAAPR